MNTPIPEDNQAGAHAAPGPAIALDGTPLPKISDDLQWTPEQLAAIAASSGVGEQQPTETVQLRVPAILAERTGELTEEQIQSVLEEGAVALAVDLAAGPDETETLFNVQRLDIARRLPVVGADVESEAPHTSEASITVFKSADGQNMELVLVRPEIAFAGAVAEDAIVLTNHVGLVLAAQPFLSQQEQA